MARALYPRHAAPLILKIVKYLLLSAVLILAAILAAGYWLLETESGSSWAWRRATVSIPGELSARSVNGSIRDGLELTDLSYRNQTLNVSVSEANVIATVVLFPLSVDVLNFEAHRTVIRRFEGRKPEEPGDPILQKLALPFRLNIKQAILDQLELVNPDGETGFSLRHAELAGSWHERISLSRIELDSSVGEWSGQGMLDLEKPHTASLTVQAAVPLPTAAGSDPIRFSLKAEGTLETLQVDMSVVEPALHVSGKLVELLEQPGWDLRVRSSYLQWPLKHEQPAIAYLRDANFATAGRLSSYTVSGSGKLSLKVEEELPFTISANGDASGLVVDNLDLEAEKLVASATGAVRWTGAFAVEADASITRFDVNLVSPKWPEDNFLTGTVDAAWSGGRIALNEARLRIIESEAVLEASGEVDVDAGVVDLDLQWRDLRWPLPGEQQSAPNGAMGTLVSDFGQVDVAGSPDDWVFNGRAALRAADLPQGVFELSGRGDREQVKATLHGSDLLGGHAAGSGHFNWAQHGRWTLDLQTDDLNVGALLPEMPGSISSRFTAEGQLQPVRFYVRIQRAKGVLRGNPFEGEGGLRYAEGNLVAEELSFASGKSQLRLNGNLRSERGLDFEFDFPALETFLPDVAGSVRGTGSLSVGDEFPALRLDFAASDVAWKQYAIEQLRLQSRDGPESRSLSLEASGRGLSVNTRRIEEFDATLDASPVRQRLEFEVSPAGEEGRVAVELDGSLGNWKRPLDSTWKGQLQSATIVGPEGRRYGLVRPATLELATNRLRLDQACLEGRDESGVCLDMSWSGGTVFAVSANLAKVPVEMVSLVYASDLEFTQTLDGSLSLSAAGDGEFSGEGEIRISPGRIQNRIDPRMATKTGSGLLSFDLAQDELLAALSLPFSESGEVEAELEVSEVKSGAASRINGRIVADLSSIAVAEAVVPVVSDIRGRLGINLELGGTLRAPVITGNASLDNGGFRYEPLGLQLTAIHLDAVMDEQNRIDIESRFKAGEGTGEIKTSARSFDELRNGLQLSLTGEDLTLVDLPDAKVVANTNINVGILTNKLFLNGNVLVSKASLSPTNLASGKVSESEDVRIVTNSDGKPEQPESNDGPAPFQIFGTVALALGQDVEVDLDVAEARLHGSTAFTWSGPPVPVANGQYRVDGRFEAYGQLLEITEGRIQFAGTSAANPNLRLRAERQIFGNPQINSAGVLITGTAQNPEVEVYTTPPTSRDRAMRLLVTGSDFNLEQGVGAVDVGTYIAPDLYISYGIGLFDRDNVISLRYDIAKGFGIKATSGKESEGVDLSYTIER